MPDFKMKRLCEWLTENIKYIILFALFSIVLFVVPRYFSIMDYVEKNQNYDIFELKEKILTECKIIFIIEMAISFIYSIVISLMKFSYLFSEKKVNFYHSLPTTRKKLFYDNYFTGLWVYIISRIIIYILILLFAIRHYSFQLDFFRYFILVFVANIVCFMTTYSVFIFVIMITGNIIIATLGMFVFMVYFPLLSICGSGIWHISYFTPLYFEMQAQVILVDSYSFDNPLINIPVSLVISSLSSIVIFTFASLQLYKKRALECAGETIVFDIIKRIVRIMLSVLFGLVIYNVCVLFAQEFKFVYALMILSIFVIFFHAIMEMILDKNIKSFMKHIEEKLLSVFLAGIFLLYLN